MDKYKKYQVPTKAKPEDQIKFIVAKLERDRSILLEACKDAVVILDHCGPSNNLPEEKKISWRHTLKKLEQAIAKAEQV